MSAILEMKHITKMFPGVIANDDVSLTVEKGSVHTLLGENGAGKSTLMNVLCGLYRPTSGEIIVSDAPQAFHSAKDAMNAGIAMVHQHFMLIPRMSVVENCLIGIGGENRFNLGIGAAADRIRALADNYGMHIDPNAMVEDLSVGERQRVEIIKALYRGAKILILDEPTAVLTPQETTALFQMIRNLTSQDYTIIFISHKLNEVMEISNRVTVLRLGKVVGEFDIQECTANMLARTMVGREVRFETDKAPLNRGNIVLDVKNLTLFRENRSETKRLDNITFQVHEGEILGFAGVDGNGQAELVQCLTGLCKADEGNIVYGNMELTKCSTRSIMSNDISHIPEDRQHSGLVLPMNITENLVMQDYYKPAFSSGPFLDWKKANEYSEKLISDFGIKTTGPFDLAQNLSGGNQQKVVVAREVSRNPKLLIAMHPTRGLDVGAIEYIHKKLMEQRSQGVAIILVSTELEEIMKLSDRIIVLYEGKIMGCVAPENTTVEELGLMMGGKTLEKS